MIKTILEIVIPTIIWTFLHSIFATVFIKKLAHKMLGNMYYLYRLTYSTANLITLALLIVYTPGRNIIVYNFTGWQVIPFYLSSLIGIGLGIIASKNISWSEFFGLKQLIRFFKHEPLTDGEKISGEKTELRTDGLFAICRHPIYLATILVIIGFPKMTLQQFVITILFIIYMFIGAFIEEKRLVLEFGETYLEYRKKVSLILPLKVGRGH